MKILLCLFLLLSSAALAQGEEPKISIEQNEEFNDEYSAIESQMANALAQVQQKTSGLQDGKFGEIQGRMIKLASDERFLKAAQDVWQHPKRKMLLICQAVFFALMFLFRSWRQAAAKNWVKKMLIGIVLGIATWAGVAIAIPYAILGEPYRFVMLSLWRVLFQG